MPIPVEAISSWMSPWFQPKLWLVRAGMNAHAAGVPLRQAAELFSLMGYRPALAETEALLEQTTAPAS
jgi:hypothetical protein